MKKHSKKTFRRTFTATMLSLSMLLTPAVSGMNSLSSVYAAQTAVIRGTNVNVRAAASTSSQSLTSLGNNTAVSILNQTTGADGKVWCQISAGGVTGYVRSDFVTSQSTSYSSDANFEAYLTQQGFPESYKSGLRALHAQYPNWIFHAVQTGIDWNTAVATELQGTSSLIESSAKSSWKSTEDGKFDWTTSTWPGFDGATWVGASKEIVSYYMDPRNFLDDSYVFQFAVHDYDSSMQTIEGLRSMLSGTFLDSQVAIDASSPLYVAAAAAQGITSTAGSTESTVTVSENTTAGTSTGSESVLGYEGPGAVNESTSMASVGSQSISTITAANVLEGTDSVTASASGSGPVPGSGPSGSTVSAAAVTQTVTVSYADLIMEAAEQTKVNPYVLAAMILQEQGSKGGSASISGASGYYNYFNVGAYAANGMTAVERGLWYASQSGSYHRPWNTPERAIIGGAMFYAQNYTAAGQNTLYLKRFNVQGSNMFKHQYMTNTEGAAGEGRNLGKAYNSTMRAGAIVFNIPVYSGMPETASPMPTKDGNPNNKLQSLSVDGFTLTPSFSLDTSAYTLVVDPSVSSVNVSAIAYHSAATITGTGTILLDQPTKSIIVTVTAENGDQRNYQITISKASGGQLGALGWTGISSTADTGLSLVPSGTAGAIASSTNTTVAGAAPGSTLVTDVVAVTNTPM